ncbi:hypothetical protein RJT34_04689 [Clitoria ternatea]|uniref:Uncharacterized protein n=1 Tax=Clitoria ternatea TaxID=43366 RepID=A0AAN9KLI7_CLITE
MKTHGFVNNHLQQSFQNFLSVADHILFDCLGSLKSLKLESLLLEGLSLWRVWLLRKTNIAIRQSKRDENNGKNRIILVSLFSSLQFSLHLG